MTLNEQWQQILENQNENAGASEEFNRYLEQETVLYKRLLGEKRFVLDGTVEALSAEFGMDQVTFTGFLDGGNTSLVKEVDLESLDASTELHVEFVPATLFYNMLMAKANWLYDLPEWDSILSTEARRDIRMKYNQDTRATSEKVGRNDPCPCGSGKKYKKCCGANT